MFLANNMIKNVLLLIITMHLICIFLFDLLFLFFFLRRFVVFISLFNSGIVLFSMEQLCLYFQ